MNSTSALMAKLVELGASLRPPASLESITETERVLRTGFPVGVLDFYGSCNGVQDSTSERIWDFFSLETMIERTLQRREQDYLLINKAEKLPYLDLVCFCDVL